MAVVVEPCPAPSLLSLLLPPSKCVVTLWRRLEVTSAEKRSSLRQTNCDGSPSSSSNSFSFLARDYSNSRTRLDLASPINYRNNWHADMPSVYFFSIGPNQDVWLLLVPHSCIYLSSWAVCPRLIGNEPWFYEPPLLLLLLLLLLIYCNWELVGGALAWRKRAGLYLCISPL
jgi:hypothetical protein